MKSVAKECVRDHVQVIRAFHMQIMNKQNLRCVERRGIMRVEPHGLLKRPTSHQPDASFQRLLHRFISTS